MANQETKKLDNIIASRRAMLLGGGAALAAIAMPGTAKAALAPASIGDSDILNFALNLEYLEANFYYVAAFGSTIDNPTAASIALGQPSTPIGLGGVGTNVNGIRATVGTGTNVPFANPAVKAYAIETAIEEGKHVGFLRSALGNLAVAQPALDISPAGAFTGVATAAAVGAPFVVGGVFNPYLNDANFLAAAYIFEDVGVTAYKGAAPLISTTTMGKTYLQAAASILAVEAYHSGLIRTTLNNLDPTGANGYLAATQKISILRAMLSKAALSTASVDDFGVYPGTYPQLGTTNPPATGNVSLAGTSVTSANIANADPSTLIAFSRNTTQVLNIVTGGGALTAGTKASGVFFPSGMNGAIA